MFNLFNLFKRSKIEDWEMSFLVATCKLLGADYEKYIEQLCSSWIEGVSLGMTDTPNYVHLRYKAGFYEQFEKLTEKGFRITNIKVADIKSGHGLEVTIHFAYGILLGYSIKEKLDEYKFSLETIDVSSARIVYQKNENFLRVSPFLSDAEKQCINESDVYATLIDGKEYYHLKELEDGDFVGIDSNNNLYLLTHAPFSIMELDRDSLIRYIS